MSTNSTTLDQDLLSIPLNAQIQSGFVDLDLPSIFHQSGVIEKSDHRVSRLQKWLRARVHAVLDHLQFGHLTVQDVLGETQFGNPESSLRCTLRVTDMSVYRAMITGGSNGIAESYIEGQWHCDSPTSLVRVFLRNRSVLEQVESGASAIVQRLYRIWHALNRNSRTGSRRNIAAHYDLGNDFFAQFLDPHMMYSSALFQADESLDTAAEQKMHRACQALDLTKDDHLVEIGSGWGGFACYAATHFGCEVTSITISKEQFSEARSRVERQGLQDRVHIKLQDYRDLSGRFDKLVSIEMIEAVGHHYLPSYFEKINQVLKQGGRALLQAIVIDDARYQRALTEVDYIKRFIFPGAFLPSYSVILDTAGKSHLMLEDLHDFGLSYARTLRAWRKRFYQNTGAMVKAGYGKSFQRMWEYYLCYCEGAFCERAISVGQLLFRKQPA